MKKIFALLVPLFACHFVFAQLNGILTYESDYNNFGASGKVITTIYEQGSKARVESVNTRIKNGVPDNATANTQNVVLFDFVKKSETHLEAQTNMAIIMMPDQVIQQEMAQIGTEVNVQKTGNETINGYNCTHYSMITTSQKLKNYSSRRDVWLTQDIGNCGIWYVGPYLYYPLGGFLQQKLAAAGAAGVVVKWQVGEGKAYQTSGSLINFQKKNVDASLLIPSSNYTLVDHSNFTMPKKHP